MRLQIQKPNISDEYLSYYCYNENNDSITVNFNIKPIIRYIPDGDTEYNMIKHNRYKYYEKKLSYHGEVSLMTSSRYENVINKIPVLETNKTGYDMYKNMKNLGYVKYFKCHALIFLQKNKSRISSGFNFTIDKPKDIKDKIIYKGYTINTWTNKICDGYIEIVPMDKWIYISPNITEMDYETSTPIKGYFAGVCGNTTKQDVVYSAQFSQRLKTSFVLTFNQRENEIDIYEKNDEKKKTIKIQKELKDIVIFIKEQIKNNVYRVDFNLRWYDTDLFWIIHSYILRYLKTNIMCGWNNNGFDNVHLIDKCPEKILDNLFKFKKDIKYIHTESKLIQAINTYGSNMVFNTEAFVTIDMMKAYGAIKNEKKLTLKSMCKKLDLPIQKIDLSYDNIGHITRYNRYIYIKREFDKIDNYKDKRKFIKSQINYLELDDVLDEDLLEFVKSNMIFKDHDDEKLLNEFEYVKKYALYDVLVLVEAEKKLDLIDWLYTNANQSFISIDEKINRGISYIESCYLDQVAYYRNMYISSNVEITYKPNGGYTAPITSFKLIKGVISDLDANSMYPAMMEGFNISSGTVFDDYEIVISMKEQGYKFREDTLDFTTEVENIYLDYDKKISFKDIELMCPKYLNDKKMKNINRKFLRLQDILIYNFTIQLSPFSLIGGPFKDIKYNKRGSFFTGNLYDVDKSIILNNEKEIQKYMKQNYDNWKLSNIKPTHIKLNTLTYTMKGKKNKYLNTIEIYSNATLMVTMNISDNSRIYNNKFLPHRVKAVYNRPVWYSILNHRSLFPHSQLELSKIRKHKKKLMKPLSNKKAIANRNEGDKLTIEEESLLKKLDIEQASTKVLMNAMYGYLNTLGSISNNVSAAASITTNGRRSIIDVYESLVRFGGYITSGDTDSAMCLFNFIDIDRLNKNFYNQKKINEKLIENETDKNKINELIKWNSYHWSNRLKDSIVEMGNYHLIKCGNKMRLGADGIFIFFLTLAKKNYLRMDVVKNEFEPIGLPFIKSGFSKIYCDVGLSILKKFGDRYSNKTLQEIKDEEYNKFYDLFTDEEYNKYVSIDFKPKKPPKFVEIKTRFKSVQLKNAISISKINGFDPLQTGEVWFVTNGKIGIDFRSLNNMRNSYIFFKDILTNQINKIDTYLNKQRVLN